MLICRKRSVAREGAIAVELAILLPFLVFLSAIGVDFARVFSRTIILETASRNAALWASSEPAHATDKVGIEAVARRDLQDFVGSTPEPVVTSSTYTAADGQQHVVVTVSYTFNTIMKFPGVPNSSKLNRATDMRVCPMYPKTGTN